MRKGQAYLAISIAFIILSLSLMYFVDNVSKVTGKAVSDLSVDYCSNSSNIGKIGPNNGMCCNITSGCGVGKDSSCYFCGTDNECKFLVGTKSGCEVCARCDGTGSCVEDNTIVNSCSVFNLPKVEECYYTPDSVDLTYDYYLGFDSTCSAKHTCTQAPANWKDSINHDCNKAKCGAECESNNDCACPFNGCIDADNDGNLNDWADYGAGFGRCDGCVCNISTKSGGGCAPQITRNTQNCANESFNVKVDILWDNYHKIVAGKEVNMPVAVENIGVQVLRNVVVNLYVIGRDKVKTFVNRETFPVLNAGERKEVQFSYKFAEEWNYNISAEVVVARDGDLSNNRESIIVGSIVEKPEIAFTDVLFEDDLIVGNKTNVTITLQHFGSKVANSVVVYLYYQPNEYPTQLIGSKQIGNMGIGNRNTTKIEWTPQKQGVNSMLLTVNYSYNNVQYSSSVTRSSQVELFAVDIGVDIEFVDSTTSKKLDHAIVNDSHDIKLIFKNIGQYAAENISYRLYDNSIEINSSLITKVEFGQTKEIEYNWTPKTVGTHELKIVASLDKDYDATNNEKKVLLDVGQKGQSLFNITNSSKAFVKRQVTLINTVQTIESPRLIETIGVPQDITIAISNKPLEYVYVTYNSSKISKEMAVVSDYDLVNKSEDGILLRYVYANKVSWQRGGVRFFFSKSTYPFEDRGLGTYSCSNWDFVSKQCITAWKKEADTVSTGVFTNYSEAFAIGQRDVDEDRIPDYMDNDRDNDGVADNVDTLVGAVNNVRTNIPNIALKVGGSTNLKQNFTNKEVIQFYEGGKVKVEFDFNFSNNRIDLDNVVIEKQKNNVSGAIMIKGVILSSGETKTLYVDDVSRSNEMCIKDAEINSVDDISSGCSGSNEIKVLCPGNISVYNCTIVGGQYKISGLSHSGVKELPECVEQWQCSSWSECKDGKKTRTCTDAQRCGTTIDVPSTNIECSDTEKKKEIEKKEKRVSVTLGSLSTIATTARVSLQDRVSFLVEGKMYFIEIIKDGSNFVEMIISPAYDSVVLTIGQTTTLDLDNDRTEDIEVRLVSLKDRRAILEVKAFKHAIEEAPERKKKLADIEDIKANKDKEMPEEELPEEKTSYRWITTLILGLIAAFLVFRTTYKGKNLLIKTPHHEVLSMFVHDLFDKNNSREQVIKILVQRGWEAKDVARVVNAVEKHRAYSNLDSLITYIEDSLEAGHSKRDVILSLLKKGWSRDTIKAAFKGEKRLRKFIR